MTTLWLIFGILSGIYGLLLLIVSMNDPDGKLHRQESVWIIICSLMAFSLAFSEAKSNTLQDDSLQLIELQQLLIDLQEERIEQLKRGEYFYDEDDLIT